MEVKMTKILALEGGVGAGKSTQAQKLFELQGFPIIHEYGVYSAGSSAFPKFPSENQQAFTNAVKFFCEIEERRLADLHALLDSGEHEWVVIDRSYHTCLAFDYATNQHRPRFFEHSKQLWGESCRIEPDLTIFIDIPHRIRLDRIKERGRGCLPYFLDQEFNRLLKEYFSILASQSSVIWLNGADEANILTSKIVGQLR